MPNCCAILLRMRLAYAITVTSDAVGSYPAFSPLPIQAVIFCSAFCQKGRYAVEKKSVKQWQPSFLPGYYPAFFPVEPGLYLTQLPLSLERLCATMYPHNFTVLLNSLLTKQWINYHQNPFQMNLHHRRFLNLYHHHRADHLHHQSL